MSFLGAGIGYRRAHRDALLAASGDARPDLLEVIPGHFFADPEAIAPLAERYPLVFHEVGMSIATEGDPALTRALLARVRALVQIAKPVLFSDHLALTRSPAGVDLGHLAPIWYTREALAKVSDRVRAWQDALGVPIALENIAAPFVIPEADMSEPEFFTRLVDATGCGMLLDVTNVLMNARNFGFDAATHLRDYPLAAVVQVHLAGGFKDARGSWIDSHSAPVEDESYRLLGALREHARALRAIVVERDERLPALSELTNEAARAADVWRGTR